MEKVDAPLERALGGVRAIESGIFLLNIACGFQERTRIDRTAIDADFEVQVGSGGPAGAAHGADHGAGRVTRLQHCRIFQLLQLHLEQQAQ